MTALFISDLHLDAARPDITTQFLRFLRSEAQLARALYILGDLFEVWIGDDDPDPEKRRIATALKQLTERGIACYLLHGNRDFLIGKRFCRYTGVQLLQDKIVLELYGRRVLLMHGDLLCTDDHDYQRLRRIVRNPIVKTALRHLPLRQRQRLAERMRAGSKAHIDNAGRQTPYIMDVNAATVARTFSEFQVDCIVHGHTHRPAVHELKMNERSVIRIVLGDWYEQGSVLRWTDRGFELRGLPRQNEINTPN